MSPASPPPSIRRCSAESRSFPRQRLPDGIPCWGAPPGHRLRSGGYMAAIARRDQIKITQSKCPRFQGNPGGPEMWGRTFAGLAGRAAAAARQVTGAAGRRRKTLTRTPLSTVVQRDVAEAQRSARSGKSAKRTDAGIRSGLHPSRGLCRITAERETCQEVPASTRLRAPWPVNMALGEYISGRNG
jgi:hypothetical protein